MVGNGMGWGGEAHADWRSQGAVPSKSRKLKCLSPTFHPWLLKVAPSDVNSPVVLTRLMCGLREMPQVESAGVSRRTLPVCTEAGCQGDLDRGDM